MENNAKILIADENAQTRHLTKEALLRKGFHNKSMERFSQIG